MDLRVWEGVDRYINHKLALEDDVLDAVLRANRAAHLPAIDVSPAQGKLLSLFTEMVDARRVLEIGTLGGYSTIWMARGMRPGGRIITLEFWPSYAEVARANIEAAGLSHMIEVRQGRAVDSLPKLFAEGLYPFDFIFIDADKASNAIYLDWAVRLSRPGTVIICDNVIRNGAVIDEGPGDATLQGARDVFDLLGAHPRLSATAVQTVGSKGYDGFAMAVVRAPAGEVAS